MIHQRKFHGATDTVGCAVQSTCRSSLRANIPHTCPQRPLCATLITPKEVRNKHLIPLGWCLRWRVFLWVTSLDFYMWISTRPMSPFWNPFLQIIGIVVGTFVGLVAVGLTFFVASQFHPTALGNRTPGVGPLEDDFTDKAPQERKPYSEIFRFLVQYEKKQIQKSFQYCFDANDMLCFSIFVMFSKLTFFFSFDTNPPNYGITVIFRIRNQRIFSGHSWDAGHSKIGARRMWICPLHHLCGHLSYSTTDLE